MADISWNYLLDGTQSPDEMAKHIASILATGEASPAFLKILSGMIDADAGSQEFRAQSPFRFRAKRIKTGTPKPANRELAFFMVEKVEDEKLPPDAAAAEAKVKFREQFGKGKTKGPNRSTCLAALTSGREYRVVEAEIRRYQSE